MSGKTDFSDLITQARPPAMETRTFRVPADLAAAVDELAAADGVTVSQVLRASLAGYVTVGSFARFSDVLVAAARKPKGGRK